MTANLVRAAWIVLTVGVLAPSASGAPPGQERRLFGFERQEVEKAVQGKAGQKLPDEAVEYPPFQALENGDFLFFRLRNSQFNPGDEARHQYHEREMAAIRPMRCVQAKASEGAYSCRVAEQIDRSMAYYPSFLLPRVPVADLYAKTPQANLRIPELLNTAGWFDWVFPRDWTGYDLLRVDVLLEGRDADKLMLEVEDDLVEPPVSLSFEPPAPGKWATLEMDLAQAAAERKLNLKKMNNIWVRASLRDEEKRSRAMAQFWADKDQAALEKMKFVAYVDNVRLCAKGAPSANPVLKGVRSSYSAKLPRSYGAEDQFVKQEPLFDREYWPNVVAAPTPMPAPAKAEPARTPARLSPPAVIPIRDMIVKGCLLDEPDNVQIHSNIRLSCAAALDSRRISVGFDIYGTGSLRAGPTADRVVGNNASAAVGTLDGGATWKGLRGDDWPSVIGGNQSKAPPTLTDVGGDVMAASPFGCLAVRGAHIGYPADRVFFIRSVLTDKQWWMSPNYFVTGEPRHCHWLAWPDMVRSPSGRLWLSWESLDRHGYDEAVEYQPRSFSVFVYCSDDGGVTWQSWRGAGFNGAVPPFTSRSKSVRYTKLAPYRDGVALFVGDQWTWHDGRKWAEPENIGLMAPRCVVSCGQEIYALAGDATDRWYDGQRWQAFSVPGRSGSRGRVSACGPDRLLFVEIDASEKKLLGWRKEVGGGWRGPEELVTEATTIKQYVGQRYAPADFAPVAYMCLSKEEEGKEAGAPRNRATPGNRHYKGSPPAKLTGFYPSAHWVHEPWIKVLRVPAAETGNQGR